MPHKYPNTTIHTHRRIIALVALVAAILLTTYYLASRVTPTATNPSPTVDTLDSPESGDTLGDRLQQLQPGLVTVVQVFDGDTIAVAMAGQQETVRFIGVDTPETHDPRRPVQCFGQTAADFTTKLLSGQKVRLEADARDSNRDKYGRLLRYVYLADGTLVNAKLIADGYGFAYTVFDYTKIDDFRQLEATARQGRVGLWQACRVDDSQIVKQTIAR